MNLPEKKRHRIPSSISSITFTSQGKQLILTCDKPPVELQGMEQRLLSRFKWGLQADLQRPDYETRLAILKKKAYNDGIELPEEIFEFLAVNISNNIRELEAVLISLYAQSTLKQERGHPRSCAA
ncbi:MAG: DnaA/Hda family protein [Marinilabiliales bacterium]|nr:DnaA/Hda family protein [Marinilabiliales bacterium]